MLKMIGSLLLLTGAAGLGLGAAMQLKDRVVTLRALVTALGDIERELAFRLTPMPDLMAQLAQRAPCPARYLFVRVRDGLSALGTVTFAQIWQQAVEDEPELLLDQREGQILRSLGEVLGRYDLEGQQSALKEAVDGLTQCLHQARQDAARLGKVYGALGLGAGAMLVIILI